MATVKPKTHNDSAFAERFRYHEDQFGPIATVDSQADTGSVPIRDLRQQERELGSFREANASQLSLARMIMLIIGLAVSITTVTLCIIMVVATARSHQGSSQFSVGREKGE